MEVLPFVLSFLIPLVLGPFLFLLDGRKADAFMIITVIASFLANLAGTIGYLSSGGSYHVVYLDTASLGEVYGVIIDPMSVLVGFVVSLAGVLFLAYAIDYMSENNKQHPVYSDKGRFYAWMVIFVGATLAFIYSSTTLQLLIFFEIMGLACWGVVGYYKSPKAERAAYKALLVPNFGAMVGLYTAVGVGILKLHDLSLYALGGLEGGMKLLVFVGIMIAAFTKSAQFPLYSWLPDAMAAPTPASAFLHGAAMVEMGVYLLARVSQFMQPLPKEAFYIMLVFVSLTLLVAMLYYPLQRDAKRLLAYSTIAEAGVMYVGVLYAVLGSAYGLQAAMFQLANHAFVKGLAFLTAGTFSYAFGTLDMEKIKGLSKLAPVVGASWFLALLGLAGVPPLGLFFSKAYLFMNASSITGWVGWIPLLLVLADATVFLAVSLGWIKKMVFSESLQESAEVSPLMRFVLVVLIVLSIVAPFLSVKLVTQIGFMG
ncbi:hydrogenase 4 subunit D [Thermococcus thermotolerans]|uniref:hydrogenase 4 subunit D n=1 Tax=Thermococcus thermotolerans TaxID=2969672 RepID=UPI0021583247|nr:hydrogenase 4 subunit D [Thermococcus thermotolerans]